MAFVVYISIVSDSVYPDTVHRQKVAKYGAPELLRKVRAATGLDVVIPSTLILNWRGAISPASTSSLKDKQYYRVILYSMVCTSETRGTKAQREDPQVQTIGTYACSI